jgi:NAD(P)-dependent dehydrogenase (short-subunit alcohol dehydrogenase family)
MVGLFTEIKNKWGGLDVLCANAGTAGPTELIEDQGVSAFKNCLDVNLIGAFLSVKGCLPIMKKQGKGAIIFTSSTAGLYGFPYRSAILGKQMGDTRFNENCCHGSWLIWNTCKCYCAWLRRRGSDKSCY